MAYSIVERPEARYRVIYGNHLSITPASELPSQYDALFLEGCHEVSENELFQTFDFVNNHQYFEVGRDAREKNVHLYTGDIRFIEVSSNILLCDYRHDIIDYSRTFPGIILARSLIKEMKSKKKISRRDFLRLGGKGIAAMWCLSTFSSFGAFFFNEGEVTRFQEKMVSWDDSFHPEDLVILFRNAIMARKLIAIGKIEQIRQKRQAEIPVVIGGAHTGIAELLKKGEEACESVVRLYPRWYLEAMIENLDDVSVVTEARYDDFLGNWMSVGRFMIEDLYFSVNQEKEGLSLRKETI